MDAKKIAGERAAALVENNMTIGLGTGSTAYWAIKKIAERIHSEQLNLVCTATSRQTEQLAEEWGISLTPINDIKKIDITIDGADEIDHELQMIKGGGGALLREKIIAYITQQYIIVADESKYVPQLGKFRLPVETAVFGWERTRDHLQQLGADASLRMVKEDFFMTDNGNYILDCDFGMLNDLAALESRIHNIPGVVVCGLFLGRTNKLILGRQDGSIQEIDK